MTRYEYKKILLNKGFVFEKTQKGFPSRGEEDVYTHHSYNFKFYVSRYDINEESLYGFITGKTNGKRLDSIYTQNAKDTYAEDKGYFVWVDNAFVELMKGFTTQ